LNVLEKTAKVGDSPVNERGPTFWISSWVPSGTWNPVGIWGDHSPRLNMSVRPIVNQYREGKVKSTPDGEWKVPETVCIQAIRALCFFARKRMGKSVPVEEWSGELL